MLRYERVGPVPAVDSTPAIRKLGGRNFSGSVGKFSVLSLGRPGFFGGSDKPTCKGTVWNVRKLLRLVHFGGPTGPTTLVMPTGNLPFPYSSKVNPSKYEGRRVSVERGRPAAVIRSKPPCKGVDYPK